MTHAITGVRQRFSRRAVRPAFLGARVRRERAPLSALGHGRNSLNLLRLIFALLVVVSHCAPLGGFGRDPQLLGVKLGSWAVAGFFVISGFLVSMSRQHHGAVSFLQRRAVRIFPAFWFNLLVIALLVAPLLASATGRSLPLSEIFGFIRSNVFLQYGVDGFGATLRTNPVPHTWNGSWWTLKYEFISYVAIMVILACKRTSLLTATAVFTVSFIVTSGISAPLEAGFISRFVPLFSLFMAGSLLALLRDKIYFSPSIAAVAVAAIGVSAHFDQLYSWGALPLAYFTLFAGHALPAKFSPKPDYSYGIYLWGFPLTQVVVSTGVPLSFGTLCVICCVATVPLAAVSWHLIERPAQSLNRRLDQVRSHTRSAFSGVVVKRPFGRTRHIRAMP